MDLGRERAIKAAQAAAEKKAYEIKVLDLNGIFPAADYFVICSGRSTTHLSCNCPRNTRGIRKSR